MAFQPSQKIKLDKDFDGLNRQPVSHVSTSHVQSNASELDWYCLDGAALQGYSATL